MRSNKKTILLLVMVFAVFISGCSLTAQRGSLKVDKALSGHWINSNGTPSYYFSDTTFTKVEKDGSTTNMTYAVLQSNDNDNTLTIRVTNPTGVVQDAAIKFSTDKKSMTETVSILGIKISEANYNYVDSKTKP